MLWHCSLFTFKPETSEATIAAIAQEFRALGRKLAYVRSVSVARSASDFSIIKGIAEARGVKHLEPGYELVALLGFDRIEDYYRYCDDEDHWTLVRQFLLPNQRARASIQFELPDGASAGSASLL